MMRAIAYAASGLLEALGAAALTISALFEPESWKLQLAVSLVIGSSLSMHLAEHSKQAATSTDARRVQRDLRVTTDHNGTEHGES